MTIQLTQEEEKAKDRICLALDVPTVSNALDLVEELSDYVGTFKVGKQLHTIACREGIPIVDEIAELKGHVFLDLKLHDTPNTVYEASKHCTEPHVYVFNVHVAGGESMCKKAIEGANEQSRMYGMNRPKVIGVTVLTSLNDDDLAVQGLGIGYDDLVMRRTELARDWGLDGVVGPANKAGELEKRFGSDFMYVTPGVKWKGKQGEGQKQLYTPDRAIQDCSNSILVIGSAITKAGNRYDADEKTLLERGTALDRQKTAYEILQAMAPYVAK